LYVSTLFNKLNIERLYSNLNEVSSQGKNYISTYPYLVQYFQELEKVELRHLILGSHLVYGWMPTILNLNIENSDSILELLNKVKKNYLLTEEEFKIGIATVNNSLVGLSKLLHFINPEVYAIWDSRIFKFLTGKKSTYGISNPSTYLEYLAYLEEIVHRPEFNKLKMLVHKQLGYEVTSIRALEFAIFENSKI